MPMRYWDTVMGPLGRVIDRLLRLSYRYGRQHKNLVTKDNGTGMTFAWQQDLPGNVFLFAPFNRRICIRSDAIGQGPPPLRPIAERVRRSGAAFHGGRT